MLLLLMYSILIFCRLRNHSYISLFCFSGKIARFSTFSLISKNKVKYTIICSSFFFFNSMFNILFPIANFDNLSISFKSYLADSFAITCKFYNTLSFVYGSSL